MDTAWRATHNVARVLGANSANYIHWPEGQEFITGERDFEVFAGFPGVIAAVDGCHIENNAPKVDEYAYVNRKGYHSVLLQGICNAKKKFVDVFAGQCGSMHDARVWRRSYINQEINNDPDRYCPENRHIIGDTAYPLRRHLLTPFKDNGHLTPAEINYNKVLSKTRIIVENTFALLKGRFRRLKFLYLQNVKYASLIILACCVLHNICIDFGDEIDVEDADVDGDNFDEECEINCNNPATYKRNRIVEFLMQKRHRQ
ncbi:putative nuclease HARBI1 isoform X1 [Leptopilina boulardi]|uniref:putative nuclease HARBI1 isoform X1 n=1 Tax=Leptopilina boulardi TaxID=63433 RepID=UPI0021F5F851|nr:putative nuclease HARBI1 isoform X1 [Leptopilina boulardi]XP_051156253.1 putative nuclease HARBI1 isoform X1 [Leptopilina boulardi]